MRPRRSTRLRSLETARLDRLQASLWGRAMTGDVAAVAQARLIIETRIRLLGLLDKMPQDDGRLPHGRLHVPAWQRASSAITAFAKSEPSVACHALPESAAGRRSHRRRPTTDSPCGQALSFEFCPPLLQERSGLRGRAARRVMGRLGHSTPAAAMR